jgi:hypothetical protein
MSRNERLRGVGRNPEPKGQERERRSIRLVASGDGEPEAGGTAPPPVTRTRPRRPEALVRAQVAVNALRDGLRTKNVDERRESFLLARSVLRQAVRRIEADLDRLPSSDWGPWRVEEEKLKRIFEKWGRERRAREIGRTSGSAADGLDGRIA